LQKKDGATPAPSEGERAKSVISDKSAVPTPKGTTPEPPPGTPKATEQTTADKVEETPPTEQQEEAEKTEGEGEGKKQDDDSSKMRVLCHDDNIRTKSLENMTAEQVLL